MFDEGFVNGDIFRVGLLRYYADYRALSCSHKPQAPVAAQPRGGKWEKPPPSFLKLNVDAAVLGENFGFGAVLRNSDGALLMVAGSNCVSRGSSLLAEAMSCRWALQTILRLGYDRVIIESDSQVLINKIKSRKPGLTYPDLLIADVLSLCASFSVVSFNFVPRCLNTVAHSAARLVVNSSSDRVYLGTFPQGILTLAELDLI